MQNPKSGNVILNSFFSYTSNKEGWVAQCLSACSFCLFPLDWVSHDLISVCI